MDVMRRARSLSIILRQKMSRVFPSSGGPRRTGCFDPDSSIYKKGPKWWCSGLHWRKKPPKGTMFHLHVLGPNPRSTIVSPQQRPAMVFFMIVFYCYCKALALLEFLLNFTELKDMRILKPNSNLNLLLREGKNGKHLMTVSFSCEDFQLVLIPDTKWQNAPSPKKTMFGTPPTPEQQD